MPHVNVQPIRGWGHSSLGLLLDHPRLIYSLSATVFGLWFLFALCSTVRRRRRLHTGRFTTNTVLTTSDQKPHCLSEKSRGVSNNHAVMSSNHAPDRSGFTADQEPSFVIQNTIDEGQSRDLRDGDEGTKRGEPSFTWTGGGRVRDSMPRPLRPPPLTPPALAMGNLTFEERQLSASVSAVGDVGFFEQPNPDYSSSSGSSSTALDTKQTTPATPRRKSYTKMLPISSPRVVTDVELDHHTLSFSPNSFPSSPILPLAPHASFESKEVDVKGEIISLTDESGAGWKRHTRVYGGGVCLACMANGGQHGGFYGENVRPEDRR